MKTEHFYEDKITEAAELIRNGEIVAFPTDTVYGLGADARNEEAVQKIFTAKSRPNDRALTILLADKDEMNKYAKDIPKEAFLLVEKFWPGPLTIILKTEDGLAPSVSAGLKTVGMRMPNHPLALEFIKAVGFPLAAPSANLTGRPSPTSADHVLADLNGKIAAVIDGGETDSGIESTVLDLSDPDRALILRPGGIRKSQIEKMIGKKVYKKKVSKKEAEAKHYEPSIDVYMVESDWSDAMEKMKEEKIAILASNERIEKYADQAVESYSLGQRNDIDYANKVFFKAIRALEKSDASVILVETYPETEKNEAYINRLKKAANHKRI